MGRYDRLAASSSLGNIFTWPVTGLVTRWCEVLVSLRRTSPSISWRITTLLAAAGA